MKEKNKWMLIQVLPALAWAILIFYLSSQVAEESSELSSNVGILLGRIFVADFGELSQGQQLIYAENIEFYVRKAAHICEYAMLSFLISRAIYNLKWQVYRWNWYTSSFVLSLCYAITDETHQLFVPGRGGQVSDVFVDSIGILLGILAYIIVRYLWNLVTKLLQR